MVLFHFYTSEFIWRGINYCCAARECYFNLFSFLVSTSEDEASIGPIFVHQRLSVEDEPLLQMYQSSQALSRDAGDHFDINLTEPKLLNRSMSTIKCTFFFFKASKKC